MKKILFCFLSGAILLACNDNKDKAATTETTTTNDAAKPSVDLPYTASYSSSFTSDVSDADLKTVLMSYKDWADGNISGLSGAMGDTITVDMNSGDHLVKSNADLMKYWGTYRDSLSSVKIDMGAWHKMFSTDKKDTIIAAWYDETDTYKNGKVDSASYHDINVLKNGKIVYYAQYKRPKK